MKMSSIVWLIAIRSALQLPAIKKLQNALWRQQLKKVMARRGFCWGRRGLWRAEIFPQTVQKLQMLWQRVMAKRLAIKNSCQLSLPLSLFCLIFCFLFFFLIILLQTFHGAKSTVPKKLCPKQELNPGHSGDLRAPNPLSHEDLLISASSKVANIKIPVQGVEAATSQTLARSLTFFMNLVIK